MGEWRPAVADDAAALTALERDANLVALAHVFPVERHPFPFAAVLERWERTLEEAGVVVEVVDGPGRFDAYLAHDADLLRHLAVHPDLWGRGLGREAVGRATARGVRRLWCLVENRRALELYRQLGWQETGVARPAVWSPHPLELELQLPEEDV